MASRTAVVRALEIVRGPDDAIAGATTGACRNGILWIDNNGVVVTAATDTLDCVLATAIQNQLRNGKTVTARSFCIAKPMTKTSSAGVQSQVTATVSGTTTASLAPVAVSDWSTAATIAAADTVDEPYGLFVTWTEA
jgi:NAD-dependent DNA ligase